MAIKKETAQIIFRNENGKEIIVNAKIDDDESMTLSLDFGKGGAKDHEGLHVALLTQFMNVLKD